MFTHWHSFLRSFCNSPLTGRKQTMKTIYQLFVIVSLIAFISSCSVQKRRYNKGWYVEWASHSKSVKKTNTPPATPAPAISLTASSDVQAEAFAAEKQSGKPQLTAEAVSRSEHTVKNTHIRAITRTVLGSKPVSLIKTTFRPVVITKSAQGDPDGTDTLGILSFIFALVGLVTGIGFILALILGAIALNRYNAGRGTPSKRIFAQLGFIIGLVAVILAILVLFIFLAIWF